MNLKKTKPVKQIFANIATVYNDIFKMRQKSEKNEAVVTVYTVFITFPKPKASHNYLYSNFYNTDCVKAAAQY